MNVDFGGQTVAGRLQHAWPKQRVEVCNVFADKVMNLSGIIFPPIINRATIFVAPLFGRSDISDRGIKPDVPEITWTVWNFESEIRSRSRDVPVAKLFASFFTIRVAEEVTFEIVGDFWLQVIPVLSPFFKKAMQLL